MALQEWHRKGRQGEEPSRIPADYVVLSKGRRVGRYVGAIERLYYTLQPGTIIVVPGPGYFSDVMIGQITGAPFQIGNIPHYPGEEMPARRVQWLGRQPKARFSEPLRERLQKPTPVMAIERSLRHEILEVAFDQYSIGDQFSARLRTTEADFSTLDDYNIQSFLNYVSGVLAAVDGDDAAMGDRDVNAAEGTMDMAAALAMLRQNRDLVPELTLNINSPGALRLFSRKILPITVSVLLAIAVQGGAAPPDHIDVINSAVAGDDPCALVVQQNAMAAIRMMDLDTWQRVCIQARDAAESTGLATSITVIPDPDQP
jgi:hypothetical protein